MTGWRVRPAKPVRALRPLPLALEVALMFGAPALAIVLTGLGSVLGWR